MLYGRAKPYVSLVCALPLLLARFQNSRRIQVPSAHLDQLIVLSLHASKSVESQCSHQLTSSSWCCHTILSWPCWILWPGCKAAFRHKPQLKEVCGRALTEADFGFPGIASNRRRTRYHSIVCAGFARSSMRNLHKSPLCLRSSEMVTIHDFT
jgi:hypothetical protein